MSLLTYSNDQSQDNGVATWWTDLMAQPARPVRLVDTLKKPAKERARLAADWVAGRITLAPTVANATVIFGVSQPYVSAARTGNGNGDGINGTHRPHLDRITAAFDRASEDERKSFALARADAVWSVIDEITKS